MGWRRGCRTPSCWSASAYTRIRRSTRSTPGPPPRDRPGGGARRRPRTPVRRATQGARTGGRPTHPGLEVVRDPIPGCGSLGGIYAAVTAGDGPVLVVAWDMPFLTRRLLEALIARHGAYDAFLPRSGGPRGVEPLCGVYQTTCAAPMR
ncbi:MAG: NTP transferase domain-containing protein, partial [Actinobacteria bacterium]|nr:NTP transferase domain-containing protein [Actinomycetota bacterium]NIR46068.1 NTP transferase domain-containing protein [Gemmatimonadota bacterium]NIW77105.1 NTP transferase domain-containing protein [Gemmatimonadota bacterium]